MITLLKSLVLINLRCPIKRANKHFGCKYAPQWLIKNADFKIDKSLFKLPGENDTISTVKKVEVVTETEKVLTTKV